LQARGHAVRFLLRDIEAGADLEGASLMPREHAPFWVGPQQYPHPGNFGEILLNFGYGDAVSLKQLVDAWRERLAGAGALIANVAPAAHIAAWTLGIPRFEISQGYHIPPPAMPTAPLRHWENAPRERFEAADRRVLDAINGVLGAFGQPPIQTIGGLFSGHAMLLTYPELDVYPERGPADYYGITNTGEGSAVPEWPQGSGPRVFTYVYSYYTGLEGLFTALEAMGLPTLVLCRGIDPQIKRRYGAHSIRFSEQPMSVSRLLPQCDLVACHGSHQMTAQALLAGKPVLLLPTQLEQFLITRRVVRAGAGLGVAQEAAQPDFAAALAELAKPAYAARAAEFATRYRGHDRGAALVTMVKRCEAALAQAEISAGH
jgi:UDP:flavonoid glycosyltransferase YjiC (YdhE family)